jgi:hypothetical protein
MAELIDMHHHIWLVLGGMAQMIEHFLTS